MYDRKRSIMGKWKRVLIAAALTASMILALPVWNVGRAEATETDEPETAPTDTENTESTQADRILKPSDLTILRTDGGKQGEITVDLYKIATAIRPEGYNNYDAYTLELQKPYNTEDISVMLGDAMRTKQGADGKLIVDPRNDAGINKSYRKLAQKVAGEALKLQDTTVTVGEGENAVTNTVKKLVNKPDHTINLSEKQKFDALAPGMYLVVAHGTNLSEEQYIREMDADVTGVKAPKYFDKDGSQIVTVATSEGYVYSYLPELISLPMKAPDKNAPTGSFNTSSSDEWQYKVDVTLKSEESREMVSLFISKSFEGVPKGGEALVGDDNCVYKVEATLDGKTVYSNTVSIKYQGITTASVTLDNVIPVGATVTVEEVYTGAAFTFINENGEEGSESERLKEAHRGENGTGAYVVSFRNKYNNSGTSGGIVVNHFENGENGWEWTKNPGSVQQ